jgi:hypothetical protein
VLGQPPAGQWWAETAQLFTDDPTFSNSIDVMADLTGDPGQAGFVQVMQGRAKDPDWRSSIGTPDCYDLTDPWLFAP